MTGRDMPRTIPDLLDGWVDRAPAADALVAPGMGPVSYAALHGRVSSMSRLLEDRGIRRDDRVAVVLPNGPELATAFLGCAAAAVCAPLNPAYRRAELEFFFSDLDARALVTGPGVEHTARELAMERGMTVIELTGSFEEPAAAEGVALGSHAELEHVALVLHTSGTTARPKIVPLTHANLCASASNVARTLALTEHDRCLNVMPLFHIHGLVAAVLATLGSGGSVACTAGFYAPSFFEWLEELSPTWYTAVPTMHQAVLERAAVNGGPRRTGLRFIRSSSAALPTTVAVELEQAFGVPVIESYGMTEAAHQMTSNRLPPEERRPGSVGRAAGPAVAILDEEGRRLAAGEIGEVAIRGESVFSGYAGNAEANELAFSNGWFRTGDEGYLDADGHLFLRGRLKEIINRAGEKISPAEVDEVLLAHPAVAQAVTFAFLDERVGEEIGVAVVLRAGMDASERELQEFTSERVADFKVPRVVVVLDEIPKGPTGKVQRLGLAERLGVGGEERAAAAFVEPRTQTERELAALWSEILRIPQVGARDDFFALGGDSMLAAELVARLRESHGPPDLPLTTLVWAPTLEQLAAELDGHAERRPDGLVVPIQTGGTRPPLFFVHALDGEVVRFPALARRLGTDQPLYGVRARGLDAREAPHSSLDDMVSDYVTAIRAVQPHGPYFLGGICLGAPIAVEMAKRVQADGEEVGLLTMIDPRVPARRDRTWLGWQLRLAAGKVRSGDYSWSLVRPSRQREIWGPVAGSLRRALSRDTGEPSRETFDRRLRDIRSQCRASEYAGDVLLVVTVDYPLREWFWAPLIDGRLDIQEIPFRHTTALRSPAVDLVADRLRRSLEERR